MTIISSSRYRLNREYIRAIAAAYLKAGSYDDRYSLNIIFVGKNKMSSIAQKYKHENEALPVLSFPYHEGVGNEYLLGEVFICYPQAVLLAAERNKKVDFILKFLLEHGIKNIIK